MVAHRVEIYWADLGPPAGSRSASLSLRRPVCVLTRPEPVGRLDQVKWAKLDGALRDALDIRY